MSILLSDFLLFCIYIVILLLVSQSLYLFQKGLLSCVPIFIQKMLSRDREKKKEKINEKNIHPSFLRRIQSFLVFEVF